MKYLLLLLFFVFGFSLVAQNNPPQERRVVRQAPGTAQQQRPAGPAPYVMKKDYEEEKKHIEDRISAVNGSLSVLKRDLNEKVYGLAELQVQMDEVNEILNSTAFKVQSTSDSLTHTRFSVGAFREQTEADVASLQSENASLKNLIYLSAGASLALFLLCFMLLNRQIKARTRAMEERLAILNNSLSESLRRMEETFEANNQSLESKLQGVKRNISDLDYKMVSLDNNLKQALNAETEKYNSALADLTKSFDTKIVDSQKIFEQKIQNVSVTVAKIQENHK
jgi:hypothetical protein